MSLLYKTYNVLYLYKDLNSQRGDNMNFNTPEIQSQVAELLYPAIKGFALLLAVYALLLVISQYIPNKLRPIVAPFIICGILYAGWNFRGYLMALF